MRLLHAALDNLKVDHISKQQYYMCFKFSPLLIQSSSAAPSGLYSARGSFSPLRMPAAYNQLAASSLLNQQYAAALGLGKSLNSVPQTHTRVLSVHRTLSEDPLVVSTPIKGMPTTMCTTVIILCKFFNVISYIDNLTAHLKCTYCFKAFEKFGVVKLQN